MAAADLEPQTLSPELRTLAKKLAGGKKATAAWEVGIEFLARLPGWKVQPSIGALLLKGNNLEAMLKSRGPLGGPGISYSDIRIDGYVAKGAHAYLANTSRGAPDREYETKVAHWKERMVVVGKKPPTPAQLGVVYAEKFELRDIDEGANYRSRILDFGTLWYGTHAATIIAPDGASVVIYDEPKAPREFGAASFYTWASKHGFYEAAKAVGEAFKPSEKQQDKERLGTLDETGVCAVCQRRQKMHHIKTKRPLMYDHGYQIPEEALRAGWAPRVGSCAGVGFPPWEVSSLGARNYLAYLQRQLPGLKQMLQQAKTARRLVLTRFEQKREGAQWVKKPVEDVYTPEHPRWQEVHAKGVRDAQQALMMTEREVEFFSAKVRGWKRTDTYDESIAGSRFYSAHEPQPASSNLLDEAMRRLRVLDEDTD